MSINYQSYYGCDPFTDDTCDVISGYHSRSMRIKLVGKGHDSRHNDSQIHLGVELEVDHFVTSSNLPAHESRRMCALAIFRAINTRSVQYLKFERDGSLNNGFEIISQPTTLRRHLKTIDWKKVFSIVDYYGGQSHNGGTCGLHVHVPYKSSYHTENLFNLINHKYPRELRVFSRRTNFRYCEFDTNEYGFHRTGHHVAYNTNTSTGVTTELRFFRGTTKYETFIESLILTEKLYWLANTDINVKLPKFASLLTTYGKSYYQDMLVRRGGI